MMFCPKTTQSVRITWARCILLNFRSRHTESNTSASYLDLLLSTEGDGQLHTSIYDQRDDFNFHFTNIPFLRSNIPASPAYGLFISQLINTIFPGLLLVWMLYSEGEATFSISFSNRDTSRKA